MVVLEINWTTDEEIIYARRILRTFETSFWLNKVLEIVKFYKITQEGFICP